MEKIAGVPTVNHKIYGIGEVVSREEKEIGTYITVRFEGGRVMTFAIPDSFMLGIMDAEGSLKDEVDAAIAAREARRQARLAATRAADAAVAPTAPSHRHGRTPATPVTTRGSIEIAFVEYLVNAGYCEYSAAGNPSTVSSYVNAIKKVLEEEGISWQSLRRDIDSIIPLYDIGGAKQHIGAKSNYTVINALKRFGELVNP